MKNDLEHFVMDNPFILSKIPLQSLEFIHEAFRKFASSSSVLLVAELVKYNQSKANDLEKEMTKVS